MKEQNKQILQRLHAFDQEEVLKAFELYKEGITDHFKKTKQELQEAGWRPQKEKPSKQEFYCFEVMYWVQTEVARQRHIAKVLAEGNRVKQTQKKSGVKKQDMALHLVDLKCPVCGSKMYKQAVCPGCAAGKKGYKIRLLCEDNPDHEVLL